MVRLISAWALVAFVLLVPRPHVRWGKVGDGHEAVYILHIGLKWLGYGFMASLSCTDFKGKIWNVMEKFDV